MSDVLLKDTTTEIFNVELIVSYIPNVNVFRFLEAFWNHKKYVMSNVNYNSFIHRSFEINWHIEAVVS